jgi:phage shock protein E
MQTIKELIKKENPIVIDVRNDWEYSEGHIKGAIHIPLHEIPAQIDKIKKLKGPFVLYCRSGNRSGMAVNMLKQAGISNAYNGGRIFDLQKIILN